jgi:hypothetical protein
MLLLLLLSHQSADSVDFIEGEDSIDFIEGEDFSESSLKLGRGRG